MSAAAPAAEIMCADLASNGLWLTKNAARGPHFAHASAQQG